MKDKILIQAWTVYKNDTIFYIEYTHSVYLNTIKKYYNQIYLISPVKVIDNFESKSLYQIDQEVNIIELPYFSSYLQAYRYFFSFLHAYRKLQSISFDTVYSRFPSPFGWLQKIYFKQNRVVHFVGDPIDTVKKNNKLSLPFKMVKISLFLPEYFLFIWACKGNVQVFSNGHHIAENLKKYNINAKPLISTTLKDDDFYQKKIKNNSKKIKLIYVGYLRKTKGVDILIDGFNILNKKFPDKYELTIVGDGEEFNNLKKISDQNNLNVIFTGHLDDRSQLNSLLREHDFFCFTSLSEGSPRVILEAIANGLNVISTPVGSLPYLFKDAVDILFFDFNDSYTLAELIEKLSLDYALRKVLLNNSQEKVINFKIENFISEAFNA